jgi:hypothetical protein
MEIYKNKFKNMKLKVFSGLVGLSLIVGGCGESLKGLDDAISNPIRKYEENDYCSLEPVGDILSEDEESYYIAKVKPDGDIVEKRTIKKDKLKKIYGTSKLIEKKAMIGGFTIGD